MVERPLSIFHRYAQDLSFNCEQISAFQIIRVTPKEFSSQLTSRKQRTKTDDETFGCLKAQHDESKSD